MEIAKFKFYKTTTNDCKGLSKEGLETVLVSFFVKFLNQVESI